MSENGSLNGSASFENALRIRGLPWKVTKEEVVAIFAGCNIRGGVDGVQMILYRGRIVGQAYVEMETAEDYAKGLEFHKKNVGSRYFEVFPARKEELELVTDRNGIKFVSLRHLTQSSNVDIQKYLQPDPKTGKGPVKVTDLDSRTIADVTTLIDGHVLVRHLPQ